jgi:hypothetical protein
MIRELKRTGSSDIERAPLQTELQLNGVDYWTTSVTVVECVIAFAPLPLVPVTVML